MLGNENACPLCGKSATINFAGGSSVAEMFFVHCNTCGRYLMENSLFFALRNSTHSTELPKISAYVRASTVRNKPDIVIHEPSHGHMPVDNPHLSLAQIIEQFPSTISERLDRVLLNLATLSKFVGHKVDIQETDYPLFYVETTKNATDEMLFMLRQLLQDEYITSESMNAAVPKVYWLTAKGWNRVAELQRGNVESNQGFIAMWFDDSVDKEPFITAIEKARYNPRRIDMKEHVNQIPDEIIAEIRRSKFVVADFTGGRGGVYYEAGFAMGLGIPVIWTCRQDWMNDLHFDIRQYNTIVWTDTDDLRERLYNRIRAVIV